MWLITRFVTGHRGFSVASVLFLRGCVQAGLGRLAAPFFGKQAVFTVPREIHKALVLCGVLGATGFMLHLSAISKVPLAMRFDFYVESYSDLHLFRASSWGGIELG